MSTQVLMQVCFIHHQLQTFLQEVHCNVYPRTRSEWAWAHLTTHKAAIPQVWRETTGRVVSGRLRATHCLDLIFINTSQSLIFPSVAQNGLRSLAEKHLHPDLPWRLQPLTRRVTILTEVSYLFLSILWSTERPVPNSQQTSGSEGLSVVEKIWFCLASWDASSVDDDASFLDLSWGKPRGTEWSPSRFSHWKRRAWDYWCSWKEQWRKCFIASKSSP